MNHVVCVYKIPLKKSPCFQIFECQAADIQHKVGGKSHSLFLPFKQPTHAAALL